MSKELVSDELWEIIEPLLPEESPKPKGGRLRIDDRAALTHIVFVLKSGIGWEMLPMEMGCGSSSTCWRRLRDWQEADVWEGLHQVLLNRLGEADRIVWERASLDSASVPAKGGPTNGPNPTDKEKAGSKCHVSKCHVVSDRGGIPLTVVLSAANVHDSKVLEEAVDTISLRSKDPTAAPAVHTSVRRSSTQIRTMTSPDVASF
jgi:transposase